MSNDKIEKFQEILQSLHKDDEKIKDIEQKQNYIQFCIEKLYDKLVDKIKDDNPEEEEEIDSLDEEQIQGLIIMEFIENEQDWFTELQETITVDDIEEFIEEDQFEELKKQLNEEESKESDEQQESSEDETEPEEDSDEEPEPDSILEETGECVEPLKEDLLVDMSGGFQDNQQKKIKQMVLDENDLYDIQEMIIEIGEHLKEEIDQVIEEKEEEQDKDDDEDKDKEPDGTGPHGKGNGPGKGKADGSGLKKKKDDEEKEEEDEKEEITEQEEEIQGLRKDIASYIALSIKNGNSPDYALDDAREVFEGTEIGDIIQQYDIQKIWADTKSVEELEQINNEIEDTSE